MFRRFGVEVTILDHNSQLLAHGYEAEVGKSIGEVFAKEGIRVLTNVSVRSVRQEGSETFVTIEADGKKRDLRAEKFLVTTGRQPNSDKIAIEKSGIVVGKHGQVRMDEFLRTNIAHIFDGDAFFARQSRTSSTCSTFIPRWQRR
ncbi:MAG: FAD-dependent oxidoreductase [Chthoniobacterales bacterium]